MQKQTTRTWFRAKVGPTIYVSISAEGDGDIGPAEIEKLIVVLKAQKEILEQDD